MLLLFVLAGILRLPPCGRPSARMLLLLLLLRLLLLLLLPLLTLPSAFLATPSVL